jgi:hypothetical protein
MISQADLLEVISEMHQYSAVLIELRDRNVYAIFVVSRSHPSFFRFHARHWTSKIRRQIVDSIYSGKVPETAETISLDDFLSSLSGRKARHIWLEKQDRGSAELGFLSMSELKNYLKAHKG